MKADGLKTRLFEEREAAAYVNLSVSGLRKMRYRGDLPYVRLGRRVLYDVRDMDVWIEKNKVREIY